MKFKKGTLVRFLGYGGRFKPNELGITLEDTPLFQRDLYNTLDAEVLVYWCDSKKKSYVQVGHVEEAK